MDTDSGDAKTKQSENVPPESSNHNETSPLEPVNEDKPEIE